MTNRTFSNGGTTTREQVAQRAYEIWEKAGCPDGQSATHWFQAEAELTARPASSPTPPRPVRRADAPATRGRLATAHN